jgi:hypothetical protein
VRRQSALHRIYDWLEKDVGAESHRITTLVKLTGMKLTKEEKAIL